MQVVNNSDAFNAPTGTGAVIFDYPKTQPLDILLEANNDLDKYRLAKAHKVAQDTALQKQLIGNISFDTKGALPQDIAEYIQPASEKVFDLASKVYALDPSTPAFKQGMVELNRAKMEAQMLTQESARHKEMFAPFNNPLDPDKVDVDASHALLAQAQALPLPKRIEFMKAHPALMVENKTSLFDMLQKDYKDLPKSEEIVKDDKGNAVIENLPSGEKIYTKNKGFTEEDISNLGTVNFNSPSRVTRATNEYNGLATANPALKASLDQEAKLTGKSPIQVYIEDQLRKLPRAVTKDKVNEGYVFKKSVDAGFADKKQEDDAKYILEQLGNSMNGNDSAYNVSVPPKTVPQGIVPTTVATTFGHPIPTATTPEVKYGNTLRGTNAGVFSYQYKDANGQVKTDVKPNVILGSKWIGGKPYIQTAESVNNVGGSLNGQDVDDEGYIPLDNTIITAIAVSNKIPLRVLRETLVKAGAYGGNTPQTEKMAGKETTPAKTVAPKTTKTIYQKSKSGKDIFSTDGGKTWNYK